MLGENVLGATDEAQGPAKSAKEREASARFWQPVSMKVPAAPVSSDPAVTRSMRSNRRRDTAPERRLRSALHAKGWRFRVDLPIDDGERRRPRPDIVFTRARVAVFVDGCFWHCCPEHGRPPLSNGPYWRPKLARNVQRDREDTERLERAGWTVVRLWEHVPLDDAVDAVDAALRAAEPAVGTRHPA